MAVSKEEGFAAVALVVFCVLSVVGHVQHNFHAKASIFPYKYFTSSG